MILNHTRHITTFVTMAWVYIYIYDSLLTCRHGLSRMLKYRIPRSQSQEINYIWILNIKLLLLWETS